MATNGTTVESLLGREAVAALMNEPASAKGLPGKAYTDPEFFKLEQATLFPRRWMAIGVAHDVAAVRGALWRRAEWKARLRAVFLPVSLRRTAP